MENLLLPQLRELYLHRNQITSIEGLEHCPLLTTLWLNENKISHLGQNLYNVPLLQVLWLQKNYISNLDGLENSSQLSSLSIAGNPIAGYDQILKLKNLMNLKELSLTDIHFPNTSSSSSSSSFLTDEGCKNFIHCHLPHIHILDGIYISAETKEKSVMNLNSAVDSYHSNLDALENEYQKKIQRLMKDTQVLYTYS